MKKQEKIDNKANFLDLVPEINCSWKKAEDGRICLMIPRFKNGFMKKIALRMGRSEFVKIFLDDLGATAWKLINGSSTVEQIGKQMQSDKEETIEQVYHRLSEFFSILARNRFITLKNS